MVITYKGPAVIFITLDTRAYEDNQKNVHSKRKNMCRLQVKKILWWPAWFLHAGLLWTDCPGGRYVDLFSDNHEFVSGTIFAIDNFAHRTMILSFKK